MLPMPPQVGPPMMGPQGGDRTAQVAGLQGFKPNLGSSIMQGVASFMNNMVGTRKAEEQENLTKALKMLELSGLGIPVDPKEIERAFKGAGIKLATQTPAQPAGAPIPPQQPQAGIQGVPSPTPPQIGGMPGTPPVPAGPAPPQQSPLKTFLMGPNTTPTAQPGSPFSQSIQHIQQSGMQKMMTDSQALKYKSQTLDLLTKALQGDEGAAEQARQLGFLPQLNQWQYFEKMAKLGGMTPVEAGKRITDILSAPYLNVIADYNAQMARLSIEQKGQLLQESFKWLEAYPAANPMNVQAFVYAKAIGNMEAAQKLIQSFGPSKFSVERGDKKFDHMMKEMENARGWQSLDLQAKGQASEDFWKRKNYELALITQMANIAKDQAAEFWKVAGNKDIDAETRFAAAKGWAEAVNKSLGRVAITAQQVDDWGSDPAFRFFWMNSPDMSILGGTKPPEKKTGEPEKYQSGYEQMMMWPFLMMGSQAGQAAIEAANSTKSNPTLQKMYPYAIPQQVK